MALENSIQKCLLKDYNPSAIMQALYENQLNMDQFEDFRYFENVIKHAMRTSLPISNVFFDLKLLKEICLDIASKNGLTTFVKILLRQGTKLNRVNEMYNRAPIHFATEGGHVETLKTLLAEPINLNLQAGQQTALHIAVNRDDENCAFLLLEKGASANIPNGDGLTAIYLAAMNGQRDMVELILQEHWQCLDLDNYRDHNNWTTREMIHQNLPGLPLPTEPYTYIFHTCHIYDLQYYLIICDEKNFLKNMLINETFPSMAKELLKTATQNNLHEAVISILNWFEEEMQSSRKFVVLPAARVAIEKGRHVILQKLLNVVPEIVNDLIMDTCLQLTKLKRSHISDWLEGMKLMLDQTGVDIRKLKDDDSQ